MISGTLPSPFNKIILILLIKVAVIYSKVNFCYQDVSGPRPGGSVSMINIVIRKVSTRIEREFMA